MPKGGKLNFQQEIFCQEYVKDFVGSHAAIRAGYSEHSARDIASGFLAQPHFRARVAELLKERRQEYPHTIDRMREEVQRIAFANPFELIKSLSSTGKLKVKTLRDIPNRLKPAVKSIKQLKDGVEITFHDKVAALEMLAKHFGFFEMDNDQKKTTGVAIYLPDNKRDVNKLEGEMEEGQQN
jgi:phage terminase small subunit